MEIFQINNILDVEKHIERLDAVVFDLDDTLYSEKDYVKSGFLEISKHYRVPGLFDEMWNVFETGGKAIDEVFINHNMSDQIRSALNIYRFHEPSISLYPGVFEMLERIKERKKVGIITDGRSEGQRNKIKALGLDDIPFIITDELGGAECRKPCPRAFVEMSNILSCDYEKMAYVGDNIYKDYIAPERLGMVFFYFKNKDGLYCV